MGFKDQEPICRRPCIPLQGIALFKSGGSNQQGWLDHSLSILFYIFVLLLWTFRSVHLIWPRGTRCYCSAFKSHTREIFSANCLCVFSPLLSPPRAYWLFPVYSQKLPSVSYLCHNSGDNSIYCLSGLSYSTALLQLCYYLRSLPLCRMHSHSHKAIQTRKINSVQRWFMFSLAQNRNSASVIQKHSYTCTWHL